MPWCFYITFLHVQEEIDELSESWEFLFVFLFAFDESTRNNKIINKNSDGVLEL